MRRARHLRRALRTVPVAAGLMLAAAAASPAQPERIVSLNMCTDELVLRLADAGRIASVTWLSQDPGDLRYDGSTARELGRRALARRVTFLAQDGAAAWSLSVEAVVGLGRLPHRPPFGGEGDADRAAVANAMARCDVAALAGRPLGTLSGGERRRALLAHALAVEAAYLLADELLAGLDPGHQLETLQLLRTVAAGGAGVAVVLHDLSLAARFCDRLLLVHRGLRIADGAPDEVLHDAVLAEVFGVAVLRGQRDGTPFLLPWRTVDPRGSIAGGP